MIVESIYDNTSNDVLFEQLSKTKEIQKYKITIFDIIHAYLDARKHKRNTSSHILFEQELFKNLYQLYLDVQNGNYKLSKSTCFVVTRPKVREVFAASFRDRIIHHVIISKLMPCFQEKFIDNSFSCMPGKGNYYGIRQLSKSMRRHPNGFVYKFDISGFFMNINKDKLFRLVRKFIKEVYKGDKKEKELLVYLSKLVILHHPENNCEIHSNPKLWWLLEKEKSLFTSKNNCGLPIGNLTSQLFAGIYLMNLDNLLYKYFKEDYGRYVDDFYFVTENKELVKEIIPKIEKLLYVGYGLILHPNKRYSQPVKHGCKFIGYVVKGNRIYVGNNTVSNLFESIKSYNKKEQTKYNAADCLRSLNSYLGYLSYCNSYNILKEYLKKIDEKWYIYFSINKKDITEKEIEKGKLIKMSVQFKPSYKILNKY